MPKDKKNPFKVSILLIAAGNSSRLGYAKQLIDLKGEPLILKMVKTALRTNTLETVVVLGARFEKIAPVIAMEPIRILHHENWAKGIGSSIAYGINHLDMDADAVLIILCDQPFVDTALLNRFLTTFLENPTKIIAATYDYTIGVPALFPASYFKSLKMLDGKKGAKKIIHQAKTDLLLIDFPNGGYDLDTEEQVAHFKSKQS